MNKMLAFALATLVIVPMLPAAAADPLPVPVPLPPPEDPNDGGAPVHEVLKILRDLFPEDAPFEGDCVKSSSRDYNPEEYTGPPVDVTSNDSGVVVDVWLDGRHTTIKIQSDCISG